MVIKLEDVQKPFIKLIKDFPSKEDPIMISPERVLEIINSLPTYDTQKVINDMIEETYNRPDWNMTSHSIERNILEKALSRINHNNL
jgi:hypothetical protein